MGLFSKLFGGKPKPEQRSSLPPTMHIPPRKSRPDEWALLLLFRNPVQADSATLEAAFKAEFGPVLSHCNLVLSQEGGFGNLAFGGDELMLMQLNAPVPRQVLENVLRICHFPESEKSEFYTVQCHILIRYKGPEATPVAVMERIYQTISVLDRLIPGAIGVLNEAAMTAHPIRMMKHIEEERPSLAGPAMPTLTWLAWTGGCVKYIFDANSIWFVTKGNHQFGLPELAFFGGPKDGNSTMELFNPLFSYMYFHGAKLSAGHTAELGKVRLQFTALKQYKDIMEGKYGTLVVNKM